MNILFYDTANIPAYSDKTLLMTGLGGTEATVVRIAHAISVYHTVYIAQANREEVLESCNVHYIPLDRATQLTPDAVILLRDQKCIATIAQLFPNAKRYLWLHNLPSKTLYSKRWELLHYQYEIIAVSHFHAEKIAKRIAGKWYQTFFRAEVSIPIHVLYNPIDDDLSPSSDVKVKCKQLIFASAPYKGLNYTLAVFNRVRKKFPDYTLLIATHCHRDREMIRQNQMSFLGSVRHSDLMQHLRESFCVFYPQISHVETFGLIYAEANAVGTPVLAHDFGSAREILSHPDQLIDGRDDKAIINKLAQWQEKRLKVKANPAFRLSEVKQHWIRLLENA